MSIPSFITWYLEKSNLINFFFDKLHSPLIRAGNVVYSSKCTCNDIFHVILNDENEHSYHTFIFTQDFTQSAYTYNVFISMHNIIVSLIVVIDTHTFHHTKQ